METYLLWSPSLDEKATTLSFFATAVNIQRIANGTREIIEAMLKDLGIQNAAFQTWTTTNRFITNYLTDDPDSDDWRDSWAETWDIVVQFDAPASVNKDQYYPRRTFEIDRSWNGDTSMFPVECVVIANFAGPENIDRAQKVFGKVRTLTDNAAAVDELKAMVPEAGGDLFENLQRELMSLPARPVPTVRTRTGQAQQLLISLGSVEDEFFENGATAASLIFDLCNALGATTTHEETRDS